MHGLRHRFATMAYQTDRDVFTLQAMLGHASPETTRRYVQVPSDAMRRMVENVSAANVAPGERSGMRSLVGQACRKCGHATVAHVGHPACRFCRCSLDPVCVECGELASKHGDDLSHSCPE